MKWITVFFSIYLIGLSVLPCNDSAECSAPKAEIAAAHHSHSDESEQCSPFCSCACCGIQIVQFTAVALIPEKKILPLIEKQPSFYTTAQTEEMAFSIWQPPKLS